MLPDINASAARRQDLVRVPLFIRDKLRVLFAHIPKTGGTAVEECFRSSGYGVEYRDLTPLGQGANPVRHISPQHMHASLLEELFDVDAMTAAFTVVRDPVARFRSEFLYRHRKMLTGPPPESQVEKWGLRMLGAYAEFPHWKDNHFRPQDQFVTKNMHVLKYEDGLASAVRDLGRHYGLDLGEMGEWNVGAAQTIRSGDVPISSRLAEALAAVYRDDFRRFGYRSPT